jgi:hypothetical protein
MALNSMYEKYNMDVVRTFYLEAFQLEDNWDSTRRQFALYLISLNNSHEELISKNLELSGKEVNEKKINEILSYTLHYNKLDYWDSILNVFLDKSYNCSKITKTNF